MFALRAFKSAIFGTPGAEDEGNIDASKSKDPSKIQGHQRSKSETAKPIAIETKEHLKADLDTTVNPSGSPTKSILVTPGTISNRRKTVSFGDGVVDNEGKRESKAVKTPTNPTGNLTAQWMSGSTDGKPRSKLTQTLMDARDSASKTGDPGDAASDATPTARPQAQSDLANEDVTLNLEDPRSESGKYWKTEFDNYRVRTNREIKRLIHYRCIAKSYARKKDEEAMRLADKLREEENKVDEMERQVSRLASTIVGEGSKVDKEQLIQDLTKQTALALQYKQQVTSLRHHLERQGVVEKDSVKVEEPVKGDDPSEKTAEELRKTQQELREADAKIKELSHQNPDLDKLQTLASRAEKKAQGLEKENSSLKQTLARVKQDMTRYESRRKDKEAKAKHRESKLETRVQEYRERLKKVTREHRESEETSRNDFDEERRRMQQQIDLLKMRVASAERVPALRPHRQSLSPRKEYTDVNVYDFAGHDHTEEEATYDFEAPPSPSPRSKARETQHTRNATGTRGYDLERAAARDITADDEEVTHYLNEILPRSHQRSHQPTLDHIPPSSPPDISAMDSFNMPVSRNQPADEKQRSRRSLYARGSDNTDTVAHRSNTHRPRSYIQSTLDSLSGQHPSRAGTYAECILKGVERGGRRAGLSEMKSDVLSPERYAAAKSRLRQKQDSRKMRTMGKENLRALAASAEN